jgi:glycine cleavage system H protein
MSETLTFMMGKYEAIIPRDRQYCRNHLWCLSDAGGQFRFGFSSYAVRLMQDVYFLDWSIDPGTTVRLKQAIGNIESSKATSDLFAPLAGTITAFNDAVLGDPSLINSSGYDKGWLFEMQAELTGTMNSQEYYDFLAANWESTQRILKGQMGD